MWWRWRRLQLQVNRNDNLPNTIHSHTHANEAAGYCFYLNVKNFASICHRFCARSLQPTDGDGFVSIKNSCMAQFCVDSTKLAAKSFRLFLAVSTVHNWLDAGNGRGRRNRFFRKILRVQRSSDAVDGGNALFLFRKENKYLELCPCSCRCLCLAFDNQLFRTYGFRLSFVSLSFYQPNSHRHISVACHSQAKRCGDDTAHAYLAIDVDDNRLGGRSPVVMQCVKSVTAHTHTTTDKYRNNKIQTQSKQSHNYFRS